MRLTPEEIKTALLHSPCSEAADCPREDTDCEQCEFETIQNALLSKLSGMKLEEVKQPLTCRLKELFWGDRYVMDWELRADQILSLISPIMTAKIEAAKKEGEQAGMKKVVELLHTDICIEQTADGEVVVFRLDGEEWQAFLTENGLEVKHVCPA